MAATLSVASPSEIESIYRESHALWGAGLSYSDYVEFWADVRETGWARDHYRHLVWADGRGGILSSLKLYGPEVRLGSCRVRAAGIGAVFTPVRHRRKGHAAAMLRAVLEEARRRGDAFAILFTDIGTEYYARLGFQALPAFESWGRLPARLRPPPELALRPMESTDLAEVRAAHDAWCAPRPFAFLRDQAQWGYLLVRAASFYRRYDGSDLTQRYRLALRDGRFCGYLVAVEGVGQWVVREVGAVDGDLALMADILRAGGTEARGAGLQQVYGWLAPGLAERLPEWRLRTEPRKQAIPMVASFGDGFDWRDLGPGEDAFLPFLDQF
ncbi:MAG TPA: GNAT family N-acetyltransferase [Candidatus Polarisedimenticolaceae bacterium]|nr:GNAT family N-acetyltransferase [Candidatus Polarisedimenticolaceae bacterium]